MLADWYREDQNAETRFNSALQAVARHAYLVDVSELNDVDIAMIRGLRQHRQACIHAHSIPRITHDITPIYLRIMRLGTELEPLAPGLVGCPLRRLIGFPVRMADARPLSPGPGRSQTSLYTVAAVFQTDAFQKINKIF